MSLMLVYRELETTVRFFECFGLLINGDSSAMEIILRTFFPFWVRLEFTNEEASRLGRLRKRSA